MEEKSTPSNSKWPIAAGLLKKMSWVNNKYLLATVIFAVWMIFFDRNDFLVQAKRISRAKELKEQELQKEKLIIDTHKELKLLQTSAQTLEKYAREKHLMKKDNEDLFIVEEVQAAN